MESLISVQSIMKKEREVVVKGLRFYLEKDPDGYDGYVTLTTDGWQQEELTKFLEMIMIHQTDDDRWIQSKKI